MDIYTRQFRIRYSETNADGLLKPIYIFRYFQDAATNHAYILKVSGLHLKSKNLAWVIIRYHVRVERYPVWDETITLKTWCHADGNLLELRAFEIRDAHDKVIISGKSVWVLVNTERKRVVRMKNNTPPEFLAPRTPIENTVEELPPIGNVDFEQVFRVRRQDLDINKHVNNTVYIEWAFETGPEEVVMHFMPCEIEVNYLGDISFGEHITSQVQQLTHGEKPTFMYRINGNSDGRELTRMRMAWKSFADAERPFQKTV